MNRPGARIRALAARVCDTETMERLIDPVIADLQTEYGDAVRLGNLWRSRWIRLAGYIICLKALAAYECDRTGQELRTAIDERGVGRALGPTLAVTLAATLLLEWPFLRGPAGAETTRPIWLAYLLPEALAISLPIGLAFGVFSVLKSGAPSRRLTTVVLILAAIGSVASFANVAWLVPAANQAFRVSVAGGPVMRGARELPLGELGRLLAPIARAHVRLAPPNGAQQLASIYYARWALAFAPLVLSIFVLSLGGRRRLRASIYMATVCAVYAGYYFVTPALETYLPPIAFGWLPNIMAILAVVFVMALPAGAQIPGPPNPKT